MPLYRVLQAFIVLDLGLFALTATLGAGLDGRDEMMRHFLLGLLTSSFTCFIHVLVLFYLIGTGKDIRDAVEDYDDLRERYVPRTRALKRSVFPAACLAIVSMIVATLLGGEVHSRILAAQGRRAVEEPDAPLPFRAVTAWWVHLLLVGIALASSAWAFLVEVRAAKANRRGIEELNRELEAREAARDA